MTNPHKPLEPLPVQRMKTSLIGQSCELIEHLARRRRQLGQRFFRRVATHSVASFVFPIIGINKWPVEFRSSLADDGMGRWIGLPAGRNCLKTNQRIFEGPIDENPDQSLMRLRFLW